MHIPPIVKMTTEAALRTFFSSSRFAVVGASSDPQKYGNIVFAWYLKQSLPVTPINPTSKTIDALGKSYNAVPSLSGLPADEVADTSVSVITRPGVTLEVLKEARKLGIPAVWLQPGSFDDEVIRYARGDGAFKAVLAGDGGRGSEGWCVLMDGRDGLKAAGKL